MPNFRRHVAPFLVTFGLLAPVGAGAIYYSRAPAPVIASAEAAPAAAPTGNEDFDACREDGHTFCPEFYSPDYVAHTSWKLELVACLNEHEDELSEGCAASLDRRADLNTQVNEACREDRGTFCRGVRPTPGVEAGNDCLREHIDEVSAECRAALEAHEAAQPTRS